LPLPQQTYPVGKLQGQIDKGRGVEFLRTGGRGVDMCKNVGGAKLHILLVK